MATGTATVTAVNGPGDTRTAEVIQNVQEFKVDLAGDVIQIKSITDGEAKPRIQEYDYDSTATLTWTISGEEATITVST